jgi:hypothetical protein
MKAAGFCDSSSMRVLSPRMEPPVTDDDGSTASTATRRPCSMRYSPSASMKVDLPTPGTPEMPTRIAPPVCGSRPSSTFCARALLVVLALGFDQRDGLGERTQLARQHAVDQGLVGGIEGGRSISTTPVSEQSMFAIGAEVADVSAVQRGVPRSNWCEKVAVFVGAARRSCHSSRSVAAPAVARKACFKIAEDACDSSAFKPRFPVAAKAGRDSG